MRACGVTAPISIDTTRASVARAALDAGADIVNDVSAGTESPEMLAIVAERRAGVVLMHRLAPPPRERWSDGYDRAPRYPRGVVAEVAAALAERIDAARAAGVDPAAIVADPGRGFGKDVAQNLALAAASGEMQTRLGVPLLSAGSRKRFLGAIAGETEPRRRVEASVALTAWHARSGVRLFRVHDVRAHAMVLAVTDALTAADQSGARPEESPAPGG